MRLRRIETVISAVVGCLALAACNRPSSSPPAKETAPTTTARPPADEPLPPRDPGTPEAAPPVDEPSQPPDAGTLEAMRKWTGDLDGMLERRHLRVLVIPDKMNFFFDGVNIRGVTYDGMKEFEAWVNRRFKRAKTPVAFIFIPIRRDEILQALVDGRGDVAAAGLGISRERAQLVDFSNPVRDHIKVIPVGGPDSPPMNSLDDLAGKTVYVPASSVLPGLVSELNKRFHAEGRPPVKVEPADENLEPSDILEMVNAGLVPLTLSDSLTAEFWAKVFDQLHLYRNLSLTDAGAMAWAFRKGSPQLKEVVNEFIEGHREGTAFGNTILRKYLGSTKWVKNAVAEGERRKFDQMVALFRKYGAEADLPYLLVAAQAYQESGLDQSVRSPVGAVGVMQIKPSTAAGKPIEVHDVESLENNIKAGTKYLRFLVDQYYENEPMDRVTKGLFAVASYNAGPARIQQLRRKAAAQGLDPNRWFNNVELVAAKEIGRETVQYVANIYKYYLAYKMLTEHTAATGAGVGSK
jgi:membrane-bound lytic murein transglycosylase MltF